MTERVGALSRSRRSVLEIQELELRRVERDLHDGAQARLVSLGMNLGLAEQLMEADPAQAKRLLTDARTSAGAALSDLRDLVRGSIRRCWPTVDWKGPSGLWSHSPIPVEVTMDLPPGGLPDPLESAVYFAVAESIANTVKHSQARRAWIRAEHTDEMLCVVVGDDGCGGADQERGTGLSGVAQRLDAFDGTVSVVSPQGRANSRESGDSLRAAIAEDLARLRDGLVRVLAAHDIDDCSNRYRTAPEWSAPFWLMVGRAVRRMRR